MKKILISLLVVLLVILNFIAILNGVNIFGLNILSIGQIKEANNELDTKIAQATTIASTDYPKVLADMEVNLKKLQDEKKNYEDMVTISTGEQVQLANQYQKYEIEYLWTTIGNHATKEGVVIKIDIMAATGDNNYNLNFTVNGSYIGITEFISDIENDSALGFKIENFSMKPGASTQELQATFTCRDIIIKDISSSANKKTNTDQNNNQNTNTIGNEDEKDNIVDKNQQNTNQTNTVKNTNTTGNTTNTNTAGNTTTTNSTNSNVINVTR